MMLRRFALLALVSTALTACRETTNIVATTPIGPDTLVAYALTGTSATLPSALNSVARTTVRITGSGDFDFGFDINPDPDTSISIIPARLIVNPAVGTRTIGFQTSPVLFDSLTRAPDGYYRPDTTLIVRPGQTFVSLTTRSDICLYFESPRVYAKTVIDSVNMTTRAIYFRQVVDPNCGFRSFLTGLPAN